MFEIRLNDCIRSNLQRLPIKSELTETEKNAVTQEELETYIENDSIPMNALLEIYEQYWKSKSELSMKLLLTELKFKFKEKRKPGENYTKEFREHLDKLRMIQKEEEYQTLVNKEKDSNGLFHVKDGDDLNLSPAQINKQIKEQVTTIFNILISVISVIFAIWYWTSSSMNIQVQYKILLCLFFGILVLVAEVVVYNSYLTKIDEARNKEINQKEKKKLIKKL